jgi:TamB, inner membrane protein subunit of TAM complex
MKKTSQILKKLGRILLWILIGVVVIIIGIVIYVNTNSGKSFVKKEVEKYLHEKFKTQVSIGVIDYSLPKWINIKNVYIEDIKKDTLIFGNELSVDIDMIALVQGNIEIQKVFLKNIFINISRGETDSVFNYQFIVNAFSGNKSATTIKDTAELKLTLSKLIFNDVKVSFKDSLAGSNFTASIKNLELVTNKFQPDRFKFGIDNLTANNVQFFMKNYKKSAPTKEETKLESSSSSAYKLLINAKNINLKHLDVLVDDDNTGMYYENNIATLSGKNISYNIAQAKASADKIMLDSATISFTMPHQVKDSNQNVALTNEPNLWVYNAKQLDITNSNIKFDDDNKPKVKGLDVAHIDATKINISLNDFLYSKNITTVGISQLAFADKSGLKLDSAHAKIIFTDTAISLTQFYAKLAQSEIKTELHLSYNSMATMLSSAKNTLITANISNSNIAFDDIYLLAPALETSFPKAKFKGQSLLLNTLVKGNLQQLFFPYLQLSGLAGTSINVYGSISNVTDAKNIAYDVAFEKSNIYKKDILKFMEPSSSSSLNNLPDIIIFKGAVNGDRNNLLADITSSADEFAFEGKINFKNYTIPSKLKYAIDAKNLFATKKLMQGFLPPSLLQSINVPAQINATGILDGDVNNIAMDVQLNSSYGKITLNGFINNFTKPTQAMYDLQIMTPNFNIGQLIKQDTVLGNVAGTFVAKGIGFDYKTMQSSIKADVASIGYNKYEYKKMYLSAVLDNGIIKSDGNINNEHLKFMYKLSANIRNQYPTVNAIIRINTAQLHALHFTKDTINFSANSTINVVNLQPRKLDASVIINSFCMQNGRNKYLIDSASILTSNANGVDSILVISPFANVHAGGAFDYDKIALSLQQYINGFYKLPGYQPTTINIPDQQFAMRGVIKQSPIITSFVPALTHFDDINFYGSYTSANADSALQFTATLPKIIYATNSISQGAININSKNAKINYSIGFDTLTTASTIFYATDVSGAVAKDSISIIALTKDIKNKNWFEIGANAVVKNKNYFFRLQDSLILNHEKWKVAPDNLITYSTDGLIINYFLINSDTALIAIKSKELINDSPIEIDIQKFDLQSISAIVNADTVFIGGVLDAKATVSDLKKSLPSFAGNATVQNLRYKQNEVGNITIDAQKISDNNVNASLALTGLENDVLVNGNYYLNDANKQFDAELKIIKLNFKTLETFSNKQLQNTSGEIKGIIAMNGKFAEPHWKGQLHFDAVKFTATQLGTAYKIDNQKIILDYPSIIFPKFSLQDSVNNALVIDGNIVSKSMTNYDLALQINAKDFVVINAKKTMNSEVYGYGAINVDVGITGNTNSPKIEGDIIVKDKSDVKIILPQTGYEKNDGKTIVRFIDKDTFVFEKPNTGFEPALIINTAFSKFLNYNLNVEVSKNASLTLLIDPSTGDEIKVQGEAKLNVGVDPGGNLILAGFYNLDDGYYDLHYQILQRKFNLIKGSTINFAGSPLNANVNINAEYIANTDSKSLVSNELTDVSPNLANSFNQKIPFRVILHITGQLNKPIINFDIQLPEENKLVSNELRATIEQKLAQIRNDPASVNKQVFSLLLFGRFVGEQSSDFFKGNGGGFNDLARQSVSQFLSSA